MREHSYLYLLIFFLSLSSSLPSPPSPLSPPSCLWVDIVLDKGLATFEYLSSKQHHTCCTISYLQWRTDRRGRGIGGQEREQEKEGGKGTEGGVLAPPEMGGAVTQKMEVMAKPSQEGKSHKKERKSGKLPHTKLGDQSILSIRN